MSVLPSGKRITLAEAITWIAYRKRARFSCKSIRAKMKAKRTGLVAALPARMRDRLDRAGRQLIALIVEGHVRAGGHSYEFRGAPVFGDSYTQIPIDFLRSGVYCDPATDMILTDPSFGEETGQFIHENTHGFSEVTVDETDLEKCINKIATGRRLNHEVPASSQEKARGAPKGSNAIDDSEALVKAKQLLNDGIAKSVLQAATLVARDQKDIDRIRRKLAKELRGT